MHCAPWWLTGVVLALAIIQGLGFVRSLRLASDIADTLSVSAALLATLQLAWSVALAWVGWGLLRCQRQAMNRSIWVLTVFIIYSALRLLVFSEADYDRQRFPLLLALTLLMPIILLMFRAVWGRSRRSNKRTDDGEDQW